MRIITIFIILIVSVFLISIHHANALVPTVTWSNVPCMDSGGVLRSPVQFTVTDPSLAGNIIADIIPVKVNSTSNPTGITLRLAETADTGIFTNTNLIFTSGQQVYGIGTTQRIGINDPSLIVNSSIIEHIISSPLSADGIQVFSSSDTTGIFLNLTESGKGTGLFTNVFQITSGPSIDGSAIHAKVGDFVTILRINGLFDQLENELVIPNPIQSIGALPINFGDTVSTTYNGVIASVPIICGFGPGGGGGGLIQPSLVIDVLSSIGGSPYIVLPPSFGGNFYHFSDGLTLTQGNNKTILDISHYNQELPRQVMKVGDEVNMTFKTFESYNSLGVIHVGLFIIPRGQDMISSNSIASITWEKGKLIEVIDPNHNLSNATAYSNSDGKFQYTTFSFTPVKSYDKMSFLARAWNDHKYSTDVRVHDDIEPPQPLKTLPEGVIKYDAFKDLQFALSKDKFYKPEILAHIHDTKAVFPESGQGGVYWLYDTVNQSVTLVISDKNDNELFSQKSDLTPIPVEKKGDYKFMEFTVKQLNRLNEEEERQAMEDEASKAMLGLLEQNIIRTSKW